PEKTPATTAKLRLFVNNRAVQDAMLRHAVREALQGHLMRGYLPAGMLHLSLPPAEVDVNVHPAKREIRFKNTEAVRRLVTTTVTAALEWHEHNVRADIFSPGPPGEQKTSRASAAQNAWHPTQTAFTVAEPGPVLPGSNRAQMLSSSAVAMPPAQMTQTPQAQHTGDEVSTCKPSAGADAEPAQSDQYEFAGLTLIGQLFSLYLLCERQGQLVVIDQHAAHERILYGRMVQHYLSGQAPGQHLLFPVSIELEPRLHEILEARHKEVASMGFVVDFFGDNTWLIKQVPALCSSLAAEAVLREVLTSLRSAPLATEAGQISPAMAQVFANLACKAAIKAGDSLTAQEMLALLAQMEASAIFSRCPHGRPVLKTFSAAEVEKWFHRHGA
ncbi:MAG: hypothetical protein GX087_11100, partial [Desulfobulbaceae bacterium]|nr:hypothetical protein [Desulfobulbaceae bacterium]